MKLTLLLFALAFAKASSEQIARLDLKDSQLTISSEGDFSFKFNRDTRISPEVSMDGGDAIGKSFFYGKTDDGLVTANMITYDKDDRKVASIVDEKNALVYQIFPDVHGNEIVRKTGANDFPPEIDPPDEDDVTKIEGENRLLQNVPEGVRNLQDDGSILDVMVVWTKQAECHNSGLAKGCTVDSTTMNNIRALIDLAVSETNVAYNLSGVQTQLRLVHAYRSNTYDEDGNGFSGSLTKLRENNDGVLDEVHPKRSQYGADVVALIISDPAFCGIANLGPSIGSMFSVTGYNCATGYFSFGHEIGHNLGCLHDRGTSNACSDGSTYRYGYRDPNANFRSILAYNCNSGQCDANVGGGCTRVQRFSNDEFLYQNNAIGNAQNDNARRINDVRATVAAYYTSTFGQPTISPVPTDIPTPAPTPAPTVSAEPTESPTDAPTDAPTSLCCPAGQFKFRVDVLTDTYPLETTWDVKKDATNEIVMTNTALARSTLYQSFECLDDGAYTFTINDSYGDGIFSPGYYKLFYHGEEFASGGDFDLVDVVNFFRTDDCSTPAPSPPPTTIPPTTPPPTTIPPTTPPPTTIPPTTPAPTPNSTDIDPWEISDANASIQSGLIVVSHDINSGPQGGALDLYEEDCKSDLADDEIISLVSGPEIIDSSMAYSLSIDNSKLGSSSIVQFDDDSNSTGTIAFCTKIKTLTSSGLEVSSKKVQFDVTFSMSNVAFSVDSVGIAQDTPEDVNLDISFSISACECDMSFGCVTNTYTQGSTAPTLRVCITPSSPSLHIKNMNLDLINGEFSHDPVTYGTSGPEFDGLTFILESDHKTMVVTRLIEGLFDGEDSISVGGSCLLEAVGSKDSVFEIVPYQLSVKVDDVSRGETDTLGCLQKLLSAFFR